MPISSLYLCMLWLSCLLLYSRQIQEGVSEFVQPKTKEMFLLQPVNLNETWAFFRITLQKIHFYFLLYNHMKSGSFLSFQTTIIIGLLSGQSFIDGSKTHDV